MYVACRGDPIPSGGATVTPDEYAAHTQTIETAYGRFACGDVGEGPVVLFVHGLFMSGFMWHRVVDGLRADRRCVAYHLPDHGGSEVTADQELGLDAQADMLEAFCEALGLERFDLVANDTGGAIAQALVVRRPEWVRTLTLTNCEARDWMPSHDDLAQMVDRLARDGQLAPALKANHDDLAAARAGAFAATIAEPDALSDAELRAIMSPHQATLEAAQRLERFMASLEPAQLVALEPRLRELRVPTLAVWGTADTIFPLELAHWLRDTIPGLDEVVEIAGGRLFWPWERGEELTPHLRRHWDRAATVPAGSA